jgi:hypothetical protein
VSAIPIHTGRLVEKLLASYCERVCPPTARNPVQLRFELGPDRVRVSEVRRFCGVPGAHYCVPLAQFRYDERTGEWQLFHADAALRWRRYPTLHRSRSFLELLREFDADPAGRFWCRINGNSLRWCRSTGRCEGCDDRYRRILGRHGRSDGVVEALPVREDRRGTPRRA